MAQNRPKMGLSRQNKHYQKHSVTETATKYPTGAQRMPYFCGLWAAGYQLWPQAPFAANLEWILRASKWAQKRSKGVKMA